MLPATLATGSIVVKRLDLAGLTATAEVIGTIGIIVSLVFVAYSVNSNTNAVKASQTNVVYEASRQIELAVASDPEWAGIVLRGRSHAEQLTEIEQFRYDAYLVVVLDSWDHLLDRFSDGLMTEDQIDGWEKYFEDWVDRYLTNSGWQRIKWQFSGPIMAKVKSALITQPPK